MPNKDRGQPGAPVDLSIDTDDLRQFAAILNRAAEPKRLRRELAKDLRGALQPAVQQAKAGINAVGHDSRSRPSPAIRPAIGRNIRAEVRLTARTTGARVKVKKTRNVRGFLNAPKLMNRDKFRHRVFGGEEWVEQVGKPGWFDDPMQEGRARYRAAVQRVMEAWADRMTRKG